MPLDDWQYCRHGRCTIDILEDLSRFQISQLLYLQVVLKLTWLRTESSTDPPLASARLHRA